MVRNDYNALVEAKCKLTEKVNYFICYDTGRTVFFYRGFDIWASTWDFVTIVLSSDEWRKLRRACANEQAHRSFRRSHKCTNRRPRSAVGNVSDYRCASDCRPSGREFDPASFHTFVEIDLRSSLPLIHSRRIVVSFKRNYVYEVLVNRIFKLAQGKHVVRWTDRPDMTIAVDWDLKLQTKTTTTKTRLSQYTILKRYCDECADLSEH